MNSTAVKAIKKAGKLLKDNFNKRRIAYLKSKKDFITRLDLNSEREILKILKKSYPKHNYFCEESGLERNNSDYTWLIDPLCSSNNYAFGLPFYGLAIGLLFKNEPRTGIIYLPEFDYLFTAEKGKGAFLNSKRIHASSREKIKQALVLYDNQFYKNKKMYANLPKIAEEVFTLRILGSAAFDLSLVAMGKADARIFHSTKACDFIAGALIIEEAGGKVTNFKGEKYSLKDTAIIASNGKIHEQILKVIR